MRGGGGGQRPFGIFPKIHPIWKLDHSLIIIIVNSNERIDFQVLLHIPISHCIFTIVSDITQLFQISKLTTKIARGSLLLYRNWLQPLLVKHEAAIDEVFSNIGQEAAWSLSAAARTTSSPITL